MPRNRRSLDRDEKRSQIVDAARELFVGTGYPEVSMARIAKTAGVTATTIYWYFADKDDLLIAVLDELLESSLEEFETTVDMPLAARIVWIAERLTALGTLVDTVHTRRLSSPAVDEWHDGFHAMTDVFTRSALADDVSPARADALCRMATFVVEGIITHRPPDDAITEIADTLASFVADQ